MKRKALSLAIGSVFIVTLAVLLSLGRQNRALGQASGGGAQEIAKEQDDRSPEARAPQAYTLNKNVDGDMTKDTDQTTTNDVGFICQKGAFELHPYGGTGMYRFRDFKSPSGYSFWRGNLVPLGPQPIRFGGAGSSVTNYSKIFNANLYKYQGWKFYLAFSTTPNPDGTYNLAFSYNPGDAHGWYWWDADLHAYPIGK